jgi:hypothetical protein
MNEKLPSGETGTLRDPAELPRPAMWSKPAPGHQPVAMTGREEGGEKEEIARRRLPLAWTGIGVLVLAAVILGFAVGRQSWILVVTGVALAIVGGSLTLKSRLMDAATVGQSVKE